MALESDVIRSVYLNLGIPPQRVLPLSIVLPKIREELRFRGAQTKLSDQNYQLKVSAGFIPAGKDIAVPAGWSFTPGAAAMVEVLVSASDDNWDPVEIVNKADLESYERSGQLAVAFYGNNPARMCFSWDPLEGGDQVRVSYDETVFDPATITTAVFMPEAFVPMVGVCVALKCLPDLADKDWKSVEVLNRRETHLIAQKAQWEEEWKMERFTSQQQGATQRLAFNRNRPGWRSLRWRR